jgi:PIN domain nuclease of toxin-antitoxin system
MKFLIDTHVFLWFILNDPQLSDNARDLMIDAKHEIYLSPASHWEIAIKVSLGKYQIPGDFQAWFEENLQANRLRRI